MTMYSYTRLQRSCKFVKAFGARHFQKLWGWRTEQAKANLDPRVGPRVGPRVAPRVRPREPPRERTRGLISLFSALQGLSTKHPTKVSTEGPTSVDGRGSPVLFSPVLFFDQERGWRTEGLARGDPSHSRDSDLFSVPFCNAPLGKGEHNSGEPFFSIFWALLHGEEQHDKERTHKFGCVIAQAFSSHGASEISLISMVSSAEFSVI